MTFDLEATRRICEAAITDTDWTHFYDFARTALPAACDVIEASAAREAELRAEVAELKAKYKRLRDAINGSTPRDVEYMILMEKENVELKSRLATVTVPVPSMADYEAATREVERLRCFRNQVCGYVADMQRHVKVAGEERKWLPSGLLVIIGHLYQAAEAAKEE